MYHIPSGAVELSSLDVLTFTLRVFDMFIKFIVLTLFLRLAANNGRSTGP